jgi:hypothetical protein
MANLLNSVPSSEEFGRLMLEYETICIQSIVKSITVSSHSSEAAQKQALEAAAAASRSTDQAIHSSAATILASY